mgnify:CR=1 FL=1
MNTKNKRIRNIVLLILADICSVLLSGLFAYLITIKSGGFSKEVLYWTLGNVVCTIGFFALLGMYAIVFSSVGIIDALKQCLAVVGVTAANVVFALATKQAQGYPRGRMSRFRQRRTRPGWEFCFGTAYS